MELFDYIFLSMLAVFCIINLIFLLISSTMFIIFVFGLLFPKTEKTPVKSARAPRRVTVDDIINT